MGSKMKRARGGKRVDLGGKFFRSAWEANYARYLNWLKRSGQIAEWEYEPQEFEFHAIKRGTRYYLPDFRVTYSDGSYVWHEIKGYMDAKSKTKLKRFAKYYPDEKLIVIGKVEYEQIAQEVSHFMPYWE